MLSARERIESPLAPDHAQSCAIMCHGPEKVVRLLSQDLRRFIYGATEV